MSGEQVVRAALEQDAQRSDVHRFVLAYGVAWRPVERPADVPVGERHAAFANALALADSRAGLRYCEGFTLPVGFDQSPNRHAWCVDADDRVLDPSPGWAEPGGRLRDCYLGVAIPLEMAADCVPMGVLYEMTGRMDVLAAALGVEPV